MRIGLIDVDNTRFPNLALMKIAKCHKQEGNIVHWWTPFERYDAVYMSKVFTFNSDNEYCFDPEDTVIRGGSGYGDFSVKLPDYIDRLQPDYSIYPYIDENTAYGFLTRGCPNLCPWCIVHKKEGYIYPYMDVEEIAENRKKIVLMDNNILGAGDYAKQQLEKVIDKGLRIDFNQAMDARLLDEDFAELLARVKWIRLIRFGCDTHGQIDHVDRAMQMLRKNGYTGEFMLYTMLHGNIKECYERINRFRGMHAVIVTAQPYIDQKNTRPPQWQKDMARWANRRWIYNSLDFKDYKPRKGITGKKILEWNMQ